MRARTREAQVISCPRIADLRVQLEQKIFKAPCNVTDGEDLVLGKGAGSTVYTSHGTLPKSGQRHIGS